MHARIPLRVVDDISCKQVQMVQVTMLFVRDHYERCRMSTRAVSLEQLWAVNEEELGEKKKKEGREGDELNKRLANAIDGTFDYSAKKKRPNACQQPHCYHDSQKFW